LLDAAILSVAMALVLIQALVSCDGE
jgi:hypothetical protein